MKLVASMPVRNEMGRYLEKAVEHALTYCDEVRALDNGSDDGGAEWLGAQDRVSVQRLDAPGWAEDGGHEGAVRKALLEHTLAGNPTHVLALDADEFVFRGEELRARLEAEPKQPVWGLRVVEAWGTDPWLIRVDGGWRPRHAPVVYRVPDERDSEWDVRADLRLACPREPVAVRQLYRRAKRRYRLPIDLVHLGWANPEEREARAARYFEQDGGRFHASEHLESILWTDERLHLTGYAPRGAS
jgi:glycosyltransferase involved in cell wall biosynthesis